MNKEPLPFEVIVFLFLGLIFEIKNQIKSLIFCCVQFPMNE